MWPALRHTVPPIGDMLHPLQCLMPGLVLLVHFEDGWPTARGFPPAEWIAINQPLLVDIFGYSHFKRLFGRGLGPQAGIHGLTRASDRTRSMSDTQ
ncbi:hypothetical protein K439DRAFT_1632859 [Ramaria rubella]|nr:hypothetical protein K439DRAFT_1632859 [Ramaria rubella]